MPKKFLFIYFLSFLSLFGEGSQSPLVRYDTGKLIFTFSTCPEQKRVALLVKSLLASSNIQEPQSCEHIFIFDFSPHSPFPITYSVPVFFPSIDLTGRELFSSTIIDEDDENYKDIPRTVMTPSTHVCDEKDPFSRRNLVPAAIIAGVLVIWAGATYHYYSMTEMLRQHLKDTREKPQITPPDTPTTPNGAPSEAPHLSEVPDHTVVTRFIMQVSDYSSTLNNIIAGPGKTMVENMFADPFATFEAVIELLDNQLQAKSGKTIRLTRNYKKLDRNVIKPIIEQWFNPADWAKDYETIKEEHREYHNLISGHEKTQTCDASDYNSWVKAAFGFDAYNKERVADILLKDLYVDDDECQAYMLYMKYYFLARITLQICNGGVDWVADGNKHADTAGLDVNGASSEKIINELYARADLSQKATCSSKIYGDFNTLKAFGFPIISQYKSRKRNAKAGATKKAFDCIADIMFTEYIGFWGDGCGNITGHYGSTTRAGYISDQKMEFTHEQKKMNNK